MLFGPIVFMSRTFRGQWISVFLVFVLKLHVVSNSQTPQENEAFDKEFGNFLKNLGSQVYNYKKTDVSQNEVHSRNSTVSTLPIKNYRRNPTYNTQKAILEDVLMMKLVSYYEDKYKLTHLEQTATEAVVTRAEAQTNPKTNAWTKTNLYKYNVIDKEEVLNYNPLPTKQPIGSNRRMENDMTDDEHFSDIVVF